MWTEILWPLVSSTAAIAVALWAQSLLRVPGMPIPKAVPYAFLSASILFILSSWNQRTVSRRSLGVRKVALALAGVTLALLAAYDFTRSGSYLRTLALSGLGLGLLGWAFAPDAGGFGELATRDAGRASAAPGDGQGPNGLNSSASLWPSRFLMGPHFAATALAMVLLAAALSLWWRERQPNVAIWLNVIGVGLLLLVIWHFERGERGTPLDGQDIQGSSEPTGTTPKRRNARYRRWAGFLAVGLIVAGAAFMRGYRVGDVPYGVWFDEAESGLEAIEILRGVPFSPVGRFSTANGSLFFYLVALLFRVLGIKLVVLRLAAVGIGVLSVWALYFLLETIFDQRTALVGAALLGVSSWHVNFSRFAMGYNIMAPFFGITALYFLLRAARTGRMTGYAFGGLMLGLGAYTYGAFRLFPVVLGAYFALGLWLNWHRLRQQWGGVAVFLAVTLLVSLPLLVYAAHHPKEFLFRANQTSLFAGKPTLDSKVRALEGNVRKHALMFNAVGDPNPRHGIPGGPVLDRITAALFILGLVFCVYRWRSPGYFVLITWLVVGMQGGILSLDWEAPQAHRSLLAVPAVYGLAAVPLGVAWNAWQKLGRGVALLASVAVLATLAVAGYLNYDRYFHRQMGLSETFNAFSAGDTAVARYVSGLGVEPYRYYLRNKDSRQFQFLVYGLDKELAFDYAFFWEIEHLPIRQESDKDVVYALEPWRVSLPASQFYWYYPGGTYEEVKNPFGETILFGFRVKKEDIAAILGLKAQYYAAEVISGEPALIRRDETVNFDWTASNPLPGDALSVEWTGSLYIPGSGRYTLGTTSLGTSEVWVDGTLVVENASSGDEQDTAEAEVSLAKGLHDLRLRCLSCQGGLMQFTWRRRGSPPQVVPRENLSAVGLPPVGLNGRYYSGPDWAGQPAFVHVDPVLSFRWHDNQLTTPWSAEWQGTIHVPNPGQYRFRLVTNDYAEVHLDGQMVAGGTGHGSGSAQLSDGPHDILVRYRNSTSYAEMRVFWTAPGQPEAVIPAELLTPSPGQPPSVAQAPVPPKVTTVGSGPAGAPVAVHYLLGWGGEGKGQGAFQQARGLDIAPGGDLYVADTGNFRVQRFDQMGRFLGQWGSEGRGNGQFLEPFDVAVAPGGMVYVLDSATGWIQRFSADGNFLGKADNLGVYNPRGIAIGPDGTVYVADTGSHRILRLSPDGAVVGWFGREGSGPGEMLQPADVAVDNSGLVYVVDNHNQRVEIFDSEGAYLGEWVLTWAGTYDIPRITVGRMGHVLIADPSGGQVWVYSSEGELLGNWREETGGRGRLTRPTGIAIDTEYSVYTVDSATNRIHKFGISPGVE